MAAFKTQHPFSLFKKSKMHWASHSSLDAFTVSENDSVRAISITWFFGASYTHWSFVTTQSKFLLPQNSCCITTNIICWGTKIIVISFPVHQPWWKYIRINTEKNLHAQLIMRDTCIIHPSWNKQYMKRRLEVSLGDLGTPWSFFPYENAINCNILKYVAFFENI